ncbi:MAG: SRPBCC family protein [Mycobacteriales bacterium]
MNGTTNPTTITAQPGTPFLEVRRDFDATPARVFRAWTEPDLVARWLGPRELRIEVLEYDARSGGGYRYVHRDDEGGEFRFRGVFHTVEKDELIIQTFEWEGAPGEVSIETIRFEDLGGGRTRVCQRGVFPSVAALEQAIAYGMERGINDGMDRLAELLADDRG